MNSLKVKKIIEEALLEDLGMGDITTESIIPEDREASAIFIVKEDGVIAGLSIAELSIHTLDPKSIFTYLKKDGAHVQAGEEIAKVSGSARGILSSERVALNFLQRMSGIATMASKMANMVRPYGVKVADTRKTTPNLRILEKYAVSVGGAFNHRYGLDDAALIKDNHIKVAGGIGPAVKSLGEKISHTMKIEVEVETLEDVMEAIESRVDIIMLDNMSIEEMKEAVKLINGRAIVEASGGIRRENIVEVAKTGVDYISIGGLTHSAPALDISLEVLT